MSSSDGTWGDVKAGSWSRVKEPAFEATAVVISFVFAPWIAEAECGWLWMTPPQSPFTGFVNNAAPLSEWAQVAAFDSATACEEAITQQRRELIGVLEKKRARGERDLLLERTLGADNRCIPASALSGALSGK